MSAGSEKAVNKAALSGLFAKRHNEEFLHKTIHVGKLAEYFSERGEGVADMAWTVPEGDEAKKSWAREWMIHARDAGIASEADQERVVRWLVARAAPKVAGSRSADGGVASLALQSLEDQGVSLKPSEIQALQADLAKGEAGEAEAQYKSSKTVAIILTLQPFSDEDELTYAALQRAAGGRRKGKIDITRFSSYTRLHNKSTAMTLERALRTDEMWQVYELDVTQALQRANLPLAAERWMEVVAFARRLGSGTANLTQMRAYLKYYFFTEFKGLGLPEEVGLQSAIITMAARLAAMGGASAAGATSTREPTTKSQYDLELIHREEAEAQAEVMRTSAAAAAQAQAMREMSLARGAAMPPGLAGPQGAAMGLPASSARSYMGGASPLLGGAYIEGAYGYAPPHPALTLPLSQVQSQITPSEAPSGSASQAGFVSKAQLDEAVAAAVKEAKEQMGRCKFCKRELAFCGQKCRESRAAKAKQDADGDG